MSDVANKFETAFISGNVSFYNETEGVTVNPSPIVGTVGLVDNKHIKTMTLKEEGDAIILVGNTYPELDGSQFYKEIHDVVQGYPPKVRLEENYAVSIEIKKLIQEFNEDITAVHDISKGGLVTALALMSIKSDKAVSVDISKVPSTESLTNDEKLYSESNSRFIITVKEDSVESITAALANDEIAHSVIGKVTNDNFKVCDDNQEIINIEVEKLVEANTSTIENQMA
jgi:phosphoribosylformylglycinamidine synthase